MPESSALSASARAGIELRLSCAIDDIQQLIAGEDDSYTAPIMSVM